MQIECPICDAKVDIPEGTEISEILTCSECKTKLVVETLGKVPVIVVAPKIEEDWGE